MPRFLLEAAASGRAIVTTDVPGCHDVIEHEKNGLLVPAKDPSSLARALEKLIREPELRARLGRAARESVEIFFADALVNEKIKIIYESLASRA